MNKRSFGSLVKVVLALAFALMYLIYQVHRFRTAPDVATAWHGLEVSGFFCALGVLFSQCLSQARQIKQLRQELALARGERQP